MKTEKWRRDRINAQAAASRPQPPRAPMPTERPMPPENWQESRRMAQAALYPLRPMPVPRRPRAWKEENR
jgi:hypothetical protein